MGIQAMSRRGFIRLGSFLLAAAVILSGAAVSQYLRAEGYRRHLENSYRHAYAELSANLGMLDADLQKGLYATSPALLHSLWTQVYAKATAGQMAIGELPYGSVELEHTAAYLAQVADFAAYLTKVDSPTPEDRQALQSLSQIAASLSLQVAAMEPELGSPSRAHIPASAFQAIEADFPELPSLIYDGPFSQHLEGAQPKALLPLPTVSQDAAHQKAADFLGLPVNQLQFLHAADGQVPVYAFSFRQEESEGYVEVTQQGGQILSLLTNRRPVQTLLTPEQGVLTAADFLERHGFTGLTSTYYTAAEGIVTVNFAATQDGVVLYPDLVKVSVALDTGGITGYEALGFLSHHTPRTLPAVTVSQEAAAQGLSPNLTLLGAKLALIPTGGDYELLCHEFTCQTPDGQHVLVYVNAQTGAEERILLLLEDETGTLVI